ncbi:MAG: tetratricopeptide repeat protein [Desulfobacteraceae bacterium]|nr:tetratricopeptide repeat protein [Desulfobacteraceae bacterium]
MQAVVALATLRPDIIRMSCSRGIPGMRERLRHVISLRAVHWLVFIIAGMALYGFTLHYPFVFDDQTFIVRNPLVKHHDAFLDLFEFDDFISDYTSRVSHPGLLSSFARRPVAYATFQLNYLLGGKEPATYRAFNIAVHISNAIMLYSLLVMIIRRRGTEAGSFAAISIPFLAAMIFLVHPLQTQSVTYITQRFTSLATFFYLATMLLYIRSGAGGGAARAGAYLGSLVAMILGLLTKEIVLTVPIALVMADTIFLKRPLRGTVLRLAPHIACMGLTPLLVFSLADESAGNGSLISTASNLVGGVYGRSGYAITQIRAILSHFRLLVLPYNQNFDPDYPLYRSLGNPEIIISILIWAAFITAAVRLLRRRERTICTDLTAFSILWFPLAISISSSFVPQSDLMFEHRSYLPSLAFCTGSVAYLHHLIARGGPLQRKAVIAGLSLVVLVLGATTVRRNLVYSSRISLWSDTIKKSPAKSRPYFSLGCVYRDKHLYDQAILCYGKAIALDPAYVEPYLSLGDLYLQLDMPRDAIETYNSYLLEHRPGPRILANLAWAYAKAGMLDEAIDIMTLVLQADGNKVGFLGFMADLYQRAGNSTEARYYLDKAREADINDPTVNKLPLLERLKESMPDPVDARSD